MEKTQIRIVNNSGMDLSAIVRDLPMVGIMRNNWRQRMVTLYQVSETEVISIGKSFDLKEIVVCREPRESFKSTLAAYPSTYVYD